MPVIGTSGLVNTSRCWEGDVSGEDMEAVYPSPHTVPYVSLPFDCS